MKKFPARFLLKNVVLVMRNKIQSLPLAQIFSLSSYAFSSLATILKLLLLSSILSNGAYVEYSVIFSSTVLFSTAFFEWIRATSARLEPVTSGSENAELRTQIWSLFLATVITTFFGLSVFLVFGQFSYRYIFLFGAGVVISAAGDLILTVFRAKNYNFQFAILQIFRALFASGLAVVAALYSADPLDAFLAYNAGAFFVVGLFCLMHSKAFHVVRALDFKLFRFALNYGVPTAISVGFFLLIPNIIRWTVASYLPNTNTVAMILVIDFLQRPYFIAVGSIQAVMFPGLVRSFEGQSSEEFVARLTKIFRINLITIILITACAWVAIPFLLEYYTNKIVAEKIGEQFGYALILFGAQSLIQHNGSIIPSLERRVWKFTVVAGVEVAVISLILVIIYWYFEPQDLIKGVAFAVLCFAFLTSIWVRKGRVRVTNAVVARLS